MQALNTALSYANNGIRVVQENAFWFAVAFILALHVVRVLGDWRSRRTLQGGFYGIMQPSNREHSEDQIREEMRKARLQQQELANAASLEAEKKRKDKEARERERKNKCAKPADPNGGSRLGGDGEGRGSRNPPLSASAGYNPMQPWTSHSQGFR
jgi:hypothetical protein